MDTNSQLEGLIGTSNYPMKIGTKTAIESSLSSNLQLTAGDHIAELEMLIFCNPNTRCFYRARVKVCLEEAKGEEMEAYQVAADCGEDIHPKLIELLGDI